MNSDTITIEMEHEKQGQEHGTTTGEDGKKSQQSGLEDEKEREQTEESGEKRLKREREKTHETSDSSMPMFVKPPREEEKIYRLFLEYETRPHKHARNLNICETRPYETGRDKSTSHKGSVRAEPSPLFQNGNGIKRKCYRKRLLPRITNLGNRTGGNSTPAAAAAVMEKLCPGRRLKHRPW